MPLRLATYGDLIFAIKEGIEKDENAQALTKDPVAFAKTRGWAFDTDASGIVEDERVGKFGNMNLGGFDEARKIVDEYGKSDIEKDDLRLRLALAMCAANRTVHWSKISKDNYADTAAKC